MARSLVSRARSLNPRLPTLLASQPPRGARIHVLGHDGLVCARCGWPFVVRFASVRHSRLLQFWPAWSRSQSLISVLCLASQQSEKWGYQYTTRNDQREAGSLSHSAVVVAARMAFRDGDLSFLCRSMTCPQMSVPCSRCLLHDIHTALLSSSIYPNPHLATFPHRNHVIYRICHHILSRFLNATGRTDLMLSRKRLNDLISTVGRDCVDRKGATELSMWLVVA